MFGLMMNVPAIYEIVFPKWSNLNSIKPPALTTNLMEISGSENIGLKFWVYNLNKIPYLSGIQFFNMSKEYVHL